MPTLIDRLTAGGTPYAGARLIAGWREFNRQAALGRFMLDDESATVLLTTAVGDPLEFLVALPTIAPLADHAGFVEAYLTAAADLASV